MAAQARKRASSLSPPDRMLLDHWGRSLFDAFGEHAYLVGSAARAEAYRDIDVRLMLEVDPFNALIGWSDHRHRALNLAFSLWGREVTGLPIDFQFQDVEKANAEDNGIRIPIGMKEF